MMPDMFFFSVSILNLSTVISEINLGTKYSELLGEKHSLSYEVGAEVQS